MAMLWERHIDGFVCGSVGVFPGFHGSWEVWEKAGNVWREVQPPISAGRSGKEFRPGENPPYRFWERNEAEAIEEAKRLAAEWLARQSSGS